MTVSGLASGETISLYSDSQCANEIVSGASGTVDLSSTFLPLGKSNIYYKTSDNLACSKNYFAFSRTLIRSTKGDRIGAGSSHACTLNSDGEVLCWGNGTYLQLGNDGNTDKDHLSW